jgi:type I restriction enzyme R subunit
VIAIREEVGFFQAIKAALSKDTVEGTKSKAELDVAVRRNVTIDWTERETVRAKLRTIVKRLLRKSGYPADKQKKATETVLAQAETLCKDWAV